jgi:S-adenosylmethionine hydrolase
MVFMRLITLLTDFGIRDPYVAQMKGVILDTAPGADIVDISHQVERHDVAMGSFLLETSVAFFPTGTIHVGVVDPSVGGERLPIVIECERGILIGPNNGLLARASERLVFRSAYKIENAQFFEAKLSTTFHGRDVFARTAGRIAAGHMPSDAGERVSSIVKLSRQETTIADGRIVCSILYIDIFGNVIVSVENEEIARLKLSPGKVVRIKSGTKEHEGRFIRSYSDVERGEMGLLYGSQGFVEIAVREGSAARSLSVKPADRLELIFS